MTRISYRTSCSSSTLPAFSISSMSDLEPMMMPTRGASTSSSANAASVAAATSVLGGAGSDIGDVPAKLSTVELDHVGGSIRSLPGGSGVVAQCGDVEHATA